MIGSIAQGGSELHVEAEMILRKIVADFDELDGEIIAAITLLEAGNGKADDVKVLRRAREAAQKGAALAKSKLAAR